MSRISAAAPTAIGIRLSPGRLCLFVWLASLAPMARYYARYLQIAEWPMLVSGFPIGCDFANMWSAGRLAWAGKIATLYDASAYAAHLSTALHPGVYTTVLVWSYPPTAFWLGMPIAQLPYLSALAVWTFAGLAAAAAAVRLRAPTTVPHWIWPLLLVAPATIVALYIGQTSLLSAAVCISGLLLARDRPWAAGALLATFVVKPHLGLALPVVLLAVGQWRAIAATALFASLYLLATLVAFGLEPWHLFLSTTLPRQMDFLATAGIHLRDMYISPYALFRSLGIEQSTALTVHWILAIGVLGVLWRTLPRLRDADHQLAMVAAATMLLSPYMTLYELVLPALAALRLAAFAPQHESAAAAGLRATLIGLLLGAPAIGLAVVYDLGFNPIPLAMLAAVALLAATTTRTLPGMGSSTSRECAGPVPLPMTPL